MKRGVVSRRITWNETTPFPGNHIFEGRLKQFHRKYGGYHHDFIGTPEIFDNSGRAFPEYPDDTLFVGDGNHRRELAKRAKKLDEDFICKLHRGLSRAEMFAIRQAGGDRRTVRPPENFLSQVEQHPNGVEAMVKADVEGLGWRISVDREDHAIRFTNELTWVWQRNRGAMIRAIQTYEDAYGTKHHDSQGIVLKGVGAFWVQYPDADYDHLVKVLKRTTPAALHESGRVQRETAPWITTIWDGIRYSAAMTYNKGLTAGRKLVVR